MRQCRAIVRGFHPSVRIHNLHLHLAASLHLACPHIPIFHSSPPQSSLQFEGMPAGSDGYSSGFGVIAEPYTQLTPLTGGSGGFGRVWEWGAL